MFNFFNKNKKKNFFGDRIEPTCDFCRFNYGKDEVECKFYKNKICKKYVYDPLKRSPKGMPKIKNYTKDDFSL